MLAAHLKRLARPVRYAMDPAHEQAIRNYVAIASRSQGLPALHQQATAQDLPGILGGHTEHAANLLGGVMRHGDPDLLGILHDLLADHGITPGTGGGTPQLMGLLNQMRDNTIGTGGPSPAVLRGYAADALNHPRMQQLVSQWLGQNSVVPDAYGYGPSRTPVRNYVQGIKDLVFRGTPAKKQYTDPAWMAANSVLRHRSLPAAMDLNTHLAEGNFPYADRQQRHEHVRPVLANITDLLSQAHPQLWHYGAHGEFPQ